MHHPVTLVHPGRPLRAGLDASSGLPRDLLEQVRGRVRLLALLMLFSFAIDPLFYFGSWAVARINEYPIPSDYFRNAAFYWSDLGVVAASLGLWAVARNERVPLVWLRSIGLVYEVALCFIIAFRTIGEYYLDTGLLPNLTWAPAIVILFPLILPSPPRVMLTATVVAGAMPLLALAVLEWLDRLPVDAAYYINTGIASLIAMGFAWMGARVVYGLGREIAAARELGSYRLEEKLGEGGMGVVWRASHRMLARGAAIKLIRPPRGSRAGNGASADETRRFEREAQAIAGLRSPHTVELFDFGVADDGAFYYVMELLEGLDAEQLVSRHGAVPAERAIHLLQQMCHSLSEAESRGLVHRDVKPANVFLCHYGEEYDFVKVLDFGIVKAATEAGETGGPMGTPAFIAPEQALGEAVVDCRADIYAAGCVAYWLLTGQFVFTADSAMGMLLQHAQVQPAAPSTRTELPIPAGLDDLVLSCLSKDPGQRPQSARELSKRLAAIQTTGWSQERARDWWAEHGPLPRAQSPAASTPLT